jgi:hypothetical protein
MVTHASTHAPTDTLSKHAYAHTRTNTHTCTHTHPYKKGAEQSRTEQRKNLRTGMHTKDHNLTDAQGAEKRGGHVLTYSVLCFDLFYIRYVSMCAMRENGDVRWKSVSWFVLLLFFQLQKLFKNFQLETKYKPAGATCFLSCTYREKGDQ